MASRSFRWTEVAAAIRADVDAGRYGAKGTLPSEASLSEEHDASRVTIRRALESLRVEGLVDSRQGFGWFVAAEPVRQSLEALDTLDHQLEAAGRGSERIVRSFRWVPTPTPVAASLAGPEVLEVQRLNLADGEPFALVTVWVEAGAAGELSRSDVEGQSFQELLRDRIASATQTIGAEVADDAAAAALEIPVGAALLRIRRITQSGSGEAVFVSEHLYPAHRTEFLVELSAIDEPATKRGLRLIRSS